MQLDRRDLLRTGMIGASALLTVGAGAAEPEKAWSGPHSDVPSATLRTMVFQSKRLDASTEAYRRWYIEDHGPDYVAIAGAYLERYSRLFVEKAHRDPVDFDCISELAFRSRDALANNLKALDTPEGKARLDSHPRIGSKPGPNEAHDGPRRFSTDERLIAGQPRTYDKPGTPLQVVLMRRKAPESKPAQEAFLHAVSLYGGSVARQHKDAITRMTLTMAVREPERAAPFFDAVFVIWPNKKASLADAFGKPPAEVEVVNVLDVVLYEPDLNAV